MSQFDGIVSAAGNYKGSIPDWPTLAARWSRKGPPGITEISGTTLLYRDDDGLLVGVAKIDGNGRMAVQVAPDNQRAGIGRELVYAAAERWGPIDIGKQRFNRDGRAWASAILPEVNAR